MLLRGAAVIWESEDGHYWWKAWLERNQDGPSTLRTALPGIAVPHHHGFSAPLKPTRWPLAPVRRMSLPRDCNGPRCPSLSSLPCAVLPDGHLAIPLPGDDHRGLARGLSVPRLESEEERYVGGPEGDDKRGAGL